MIRQRLSRIGLVLPLLLVACSDDEAANGGSSAAVSTTAGSAASGDSTPSTAGTISDSAIGTADPLPGEATSVPVAVVDVSVQPGTATGFEGALKDVTDLRCESTDGVWSVSGAVTNPTTGTVSYRIYVSFLDDAGATPGLLQVDADNVAAGAGTTWTGSLDVGLDNLKCVLRVERTAVS